MLPGQTLLAVRERIADRIRAAQYPKSASIKSQDQVTLSIEDVQTLLDYTNAAACQQGEPLQTTLVISPSHR